MPESRLVPTKGLMLVVAVMSMRSMVGGASDSTVMESSLVYRNDRNPIRATLFGRTMECMAVLFPNAARPMLAMVLGRIMESISSP